MIEKKKDARDCNAAFGRHADHAPISRSAAAFGSRCFH